MGNDSAARFIALSVYDGEARTAGSAQEILDMIKERQGFTCDLPFELFFYLKDGNSAVPRLWQYLSDAEKLQVREICASISIEW